MARTAIVAPPSGEVAAAAACVDAFDAEYDYVCRVLRRSRVREADIEDVAQEVFLVVWRRWREYDPARPLRPWLAGISFRVAYNHQTRSSSREIPEDGLGDAHDPHADPERQLIQADLRGILLRALASIADKPRNVLLMHDVDEIAMRDIAALLKIPLYTAYSRLRAGRRELVAALRRMKASAPASDGFDLPGKLERILESERRSPALPPARRRQAIDRLRALVPLLPTLPRHLTPRPLRSASTSTSSVLAIAKVSAAISAALAIAIALFAVRAPLRTKARPAQSQAGAAAPSATPARVSTMAIPQVRIERAAAPVAATTSGLATSSTTALDALTKKGGLVGYWRLDDGAGSGYARDLSGSGHDCTLHRLDHDGAWIEGRHGGAIQFDGTGWLQCPPPTALDQDSHEMTISLWVKRSGGLGRVRGLVTRQLGHDSKDAFHLAFRDDNLIWQSGLWRVTIAAHALPPFDRWRHIASTRSANRRAALYVDGVLVESKKTGPEIATDAEPGSLIIGGGVNGPNPDAVTERFDGAIDEVSLFKRALGPAEIAALASGAQPRVSQ